jgi:glycosyltransferase involved in cell wall biosynthesis
VSSWSRLGEIGAYELIVVNDASTDLTGQIAEERAAADSRIKVVHHEVNRKLGGSLKSGFAAATGELVLYTDADLPFEMLELIKAVRLMREYEADLVCAYRFDRTGEGLKRTIYSFAYNWLIQLAFGTRLRDINFAFKLIHRRALDTITLRSEDHSLMPNLRLELIEWDIPSSSSRSTTSADSRGLNSLFPVSNT